MQLTANLAVLATAVAYVAPSVFALPLNVASNEINAREYDLDLDAREVVDFEAREVDDLELAARDLIEEYYQSREVYDDLDARSFGDRELEAREFLNYLDARAAPAAPTPAAPAPASTSSAATSASASPSPSAASGDPAPAGAHAGHPHAHMPAVLIHALTDEHHHKLKHYAEIQLHIFNTLVDLADGEPDHKGVKESPEVEKLAKEILQLKRWHRHHLHHGHHAEKDGAGGAPPASPSGTPAASGGAAHAHHHDLYHAKIHELKVGSHKADRYIARAKLHKDRLALIALGPNGDHDEAYEAAVKHETEWFERHHKKASHLHKSGNASDPSPAGGPAPSSTSAGAAPSATGVEKKAADGKPATPQGVKRRALRRRGFF